MKKILVVLLALVLALSAVGAFAEEVKEYDIRALIWKYDDTYGSSVRQAMQATVDELNEEGEYNIKFTMYDAADDMAKQVEQATMLVGEKPDFVIINLAEVASGQQLVDMFTEAGIPFLFYNKEPSAETVQSVVVDSGSIFIGTTPREAGDMQGEILAEMWAADQSIDLNGDGVLQFVEFEGEPNNPEAIARTKYSEETAFAQGVPLEPALDEYIIVANWNSYIPATIYLRDRKLFPLQVILREILISGTSNLDTETSGYDNFSAYSEAVKYATIIASTIPVLCIYPFLQRFFVKGVMLGAIKG